MDFRDKPVKDMVSMNRLFEMTILRLKMIIKFIALLLSKSDDSHYDYLLSQWDLETRRIFCFDNGWLKFKQTITKDSISKLELIEEKKDINGNLQITAISPINYRAEVGNKLYARIEAFQVGEFLFLKPRNIQLMRGTNKTTINPNFWNNSGSARFVSEKGNLSFAYSKALILSYTKCVKGENGKYTSLNEYIEAYRCKLSAQSGLIRG